MVQWAREEVKTGLPSTGTAVTFCHWYVYTEWDTALQNANKFSFHMLGGLLGQTSTTEEVHNGLSSTLCTALMAALTRLQIKCILDVAPASLLLLLAPQLALTPVEYFQRLSPKSATLHRA